MISERDIRYQEKSGVHMISERDIRDRIFKEFIAPTKVKKDYIGIEIEMPIINLNKKAVDFNVVHKVTNSFKNEFGDFKENGIDYDGNIFSLRNDLRLLIQQY